MAKTINTDMDHSESAEDILGLSNLTPRFPETGVTDGELIRMLREELAQSQATVNTSFRERQRQTVINEVVAERNAAQDRAVANQSEIGAKIFEHLFRIAQRDGLLDSELMDLFTEGVESALSENARLRLDEPNANVSAVIEVFQKYQRMLDQDQDQTKPALLTTQTDQNSETVVETHSTDLSLEDFIRTL